jgi:3-hydroxyisobutyrate dehydrogenase-like beta-hydroxyacid dehydrogenase
VAGDSERIDPGFAIGFIGLGQMGGAVAGRLLASGVRLVVVPGPRQTGVAAIRAAGAASVETPGALAACCDVVFTCLPSAQQVETAADAMIASAKRGFVHVDLSTSDPAMTVRLAARYAVAGAALIDAAIAGNPELARVGGLTLIAGGDKAEIDRLTPILDRIATKIVHAGPVGSGHRTRAIMSFFGMAVANAASEALMLARTTGIDLAALRDLIGASGMNSPTFQAMAATAIGVDAAPRRMTIANALKDVEIAAAIAAAAGLPALLLPATREALARATAAGHAQDFVTELTGILGRLPRTKTIPQGE